MRFWTSVCVTSSYLWLEIVVTRDCLHKILKEQNWKKGKSKSKPVWYTVWQTLAQNKHWAWTHTQNNHQTMWHKQTMLCYCAYLSSVWSQIHKQVKEALPKVTQTDLHDLKPGDWGVVKDFRRKSLKARRWLGPFQALLTTQTALKVAERATWIHVSHYNLVPEPGGKPADNSH